jgi:prepilin-type N-terminal cleavage/methylation domain-containing protein
VNGTEKQPASGFTLLEVIITLVLVGIISLFAVAAVLSAVQGFMQVRNNAETAQKVHVAMNRMSRDLLVASNIVSGASETITFDTVLPSGAAVRQTLAFANGIVTLKGKTLLDEVVNFNMSYIRYNSAGTELNESSYSTNSRGVQIRLQRGQGVNTPYTNRIFPRNLPQNRVML